jgi:putative addiction module component (TIGR02574 family)
VSQVPAHLLDAALKLPEGARAELAHRLLDSLKSFFADPETEAAWSEEIKRRIEDLESGREKAIPWDRARRMIFEGDDESDAG